MDQQQQENKRAVTQRLLPHDQHQHEENKDLAPVVGSLNANPPPPAAAPTPAAQASRHGWCCNCRHLVNRAAPKIREHATCSNFIKLVVTVGVMVVLWMDLHTYIGSQANDLREEISKLQGTIGDLQAKITGLQNQINEAETKLSYVQPQVHDLTINTARLNATVHQAQEDIGDIEITLNRLDVPALVANISKANDQVMSLGIKASNLSAAVIMAQDSLNRTENGVAVLQVQLTHTFTQVNGSVWDRIVPMLSHQINGEITQVRSVLSSSLEQWGRVVSDNFTTTFQRIDSLDKATVKQFGNQSINGWLSLQNGVIFGSSSSSSASSSSQYSLSMNGQNLSIYQNQSPIISFNTDTIQLHGGHLLTRTLESTGVATFASVSTTTLTATQTVNTPKVNDHNPNPATYSLKWGRAPCQDWQDIGGCPDTMFMIDYDTKRSGSKDLNTTQPKRCCTPQLIMTWT